MGPSPGKVVILGAGPCGLGAAFRLRELGFQDFEIFEASDHPGGLASSYVDPAGFTWDVGGHVQFSHYPDFDRVMDLALPDGWLEHKRESWIWLLDRFVPYPFQANLWRLPADQIEKCVSGLEQAQTKTMKLRHFGDWMDSSFGSGICDLFMRPYNFKVWAHPAEMMSYQWIGERVAVVDLPKVKSQILAQKDEVSWGPNSRFRFPKSGGTGAVWRSVANLVGNDKIQLNHRGILVDPLKREIIVRNDQSLQSRRVNYDVLLSTIPITTLCEISNISAPKGFLSSDVHIVGIGLEGKIPDNLAAKSWIYFPEEKTPFYRVTVFSNYSPANVPDPKIHWSLMCETSSSDFKRENPDLIVQKTIDALSAEGFIGPNQKIISKWHFSATPGYPTPFVGRDDLIQGLFDQLSGFQIYSRGRFGAWKYEVSNQDHTFMQGFEWADWIMGGKPEITVFDPAKANASRG